MRANISCARNCVLRSLRAGRLGATELAPPVARMMLISAMFLLSAFAVSGASAGLGLRVDPMADTVRAALVHLAKTCMKEVNASLSDLEYIRKEPPYPEKTSCLVSCIFQKAGLIKDNQFSKRGFIAAVAPLVFTNKKKMEHMQDVSDKCDKQMREKNVHDCQLGNGIITCIYAYAPELHATLAANQ